MKSESRRTNMRDDVAHGTTTNLDRTIENPVTGEQYTILATAEETNGELLKVRAEIPAGTPGGCPYTTTSPSQRGSRR
jgi:hypothetical protein